MSNSDEVIRSVEHAMEFLGNYHTSVDFRNPTADLSQRFIDLQKAHIELTERVEFLEKQLAQKRVIGDNLKEHWKEG